MIASMDLVTRGALVVACTALASCTLDPPAQVAPPPPPPVAPPAAAPPPRCLSVVGWNDLHGQLSADDPVIGTGRIPAGGVVALADEVDAIRRTGDVTVLLDAGDLFTGPLASTLAEGEPVLEAYKVLGVDAATFGNHEFDFGPVGYERITAAPGVRDEAGADGPRGALLKLLAKATFPFVSANVVRADGAPTGWPDHFAGTIVQKDGFHVGVVGYTTHETPTTTLPPNVVGLDFASGAAERVAATIRQLRTAGASPVVLLAHASIEGTLPQSLDDNEPHHGEMATLLDRLGPDLPDLVIAGHRHAWMIGRLRGVPIVSSDQHGVGLTRARFCPSGDKLALAGIERHTALWSGAPRTELGAKVAAAVAPWEARVKATADAVVATVPKECSPRALNGVALADQIARATAERAADASVVPRGVPVVGFVNAGGIRAPLAAGAVRYGDLFNVFPFENSVAVCGTTRGGLVRFIENAIHRDSVRERFPFGIAGAKLTLKRDAEGRLTLGSVVLDGEKRPGKETDVVWLAISDFLLFGGDGLLKGISCGPAVASQTRVREAWRAVLARERACDGASSNVKIEGPRRE